MLLSRWLRRRRPTQEGRRPVRAFRPTIQVLEDRTVPSFFGRGYPPWLAFFSQAASGPATHLAVIVPENVQSSTGFNVIVEAEDASNRLATGYTGTVSLTSSDTGATLPSSYTFTAQDHGIHVFHVTLSATGSQTITASDTTSTSTTGSATTTVNPAPTATQIVVIAPEQAATGVPTNVTVAALDAAGHLVPNYTGTVSLTSSDTSATLPADYTFTASDHGYHTFQVTYQTTGSQTVTATDTANSPLTSQASTAVSAPGTVTHFGVFALGPTVPGVSTPVVVVALDASNQVVSGYTGTVHFTSGDSSATLPADYTFTASDNGVHVFNVTFGTSGRQTLTATDTSNSAATGNAYVRVFQQFPWQSLLFGGFAGF